MSAVVSTPTGAWDGPTILAAATAVVALLVSLWPRILRIIKGCRIEIVIAESVMITHYMGNIHVVCFLSLINTGAVQARIGRLTCVLKRPDGVGVVLPAQAYISREAPAIQGQGSPEYPLGWVIVAPDGQWSETVRFYEPWSDETAQESSDVAESIRADISRQLPGLQEPEQLAEARSELVERAHELFESNFDLSAGDYMISVIAETPDGRCLRQRDFSFRLHGSAVGTLRGGVDEYKYGFGVCFPSSQPFSVAWVRVRGASERSSPRVADRR